MQLRCPGLLSIAWFSFLWGIFRGDRASRCFGKFSIIADYCCFEGGHVPNCFSPPFTFETCCPQEASGADMSALRAALVRHLLVSWEFYTGRESTLSRSELFLDIILQLQVRGTFVEVGVQRGAFGSDIFHRLNGLGHLDVVDNYFLVDTWRNTLGYEDRANYANPAQMENFITSIKAMADVWSKVSFLQLESTRAAGLFSEDSLDFVYLDARHDYCGVIDDINAFWPKLREGGLMGGDDFTWSETWTLCRNGSHIVGGVAKAVLHGLKRKGIEVLDLHEQWLAQKPYTSNRSLQNKSAITDPCAHWKILAKMRSSSGYSKFWIPKRAELEYAKVQMLKTRCETRNSA